MNKKIVLWYDNLEKNNCSYRDSVLTAPKIIEKLNRYGIKYELKETGSSMNSSHLNLYFIELNNVHLDFDIFSIMSANAKTLLNQGMAIVFYYPSEGHVLDGWFEMLYTNLLTNGLIGSKIFFVFGDADFKSSYEKFVSETKIPTFLVPITLDFFLSDYFERVNCFNSSLDSEREYDYLFYNGKLRAHRLLSVAELDHRNIISNGLVSFTDSVHTGRSSDLNKCISDLRAVGYCPPHVCKFADEFKPMVLDMPGDDFSQDNINDTIVSHYSGSYFSIVGESNVITRFQTEKSFKPIANMHPFILIAAPGSLALLKEKGFETFSELFDESYDTEQNHVTRILMVIDEVEKFTKLNDRHKKDIFDSVKDKLMYNKRHYIKLAVDSGKHEHLRMFKEIEKSNES